MVIDDDKNSNGVSNGVDDNIEGNYDNNSNLTVMVMLVTIRSGIRWITRKIFPLIDLMYVHFHLLHYENILNMNYVKLSTFMI